MRKTFKQRAMAGMLVSAMVATSLTGCGSKSETAATTAAASNNGGAAQETAKEEKKEEPVQMEWLISTSTSAEINDDAEVVKMIEERFNIDLKAWHVDSAKANEQLSVRFAGGEMPDVLTYGGGPQLAEYAKGGIAADIPMDLVREKAPHYVEAVEKYGDSDAWAQMEYDGKHYGFSNPQDNIPMTLIWNKKWLDNLGLEVPTTIEEFEKVMIAFVEDDPDGNGKDDTAGMAERTFNAIFGAYGLRCVTGAKPQLKASEMQLGDDGVPFVPYVRPEAKEVVSLLHDWYEKGIIDKEFITGENHGGYQWLSHSFMNGRIGVTSAQPYHWLNTDRDMNDPKTWGVCMKEFKGLNPDGEIVFGPAPVGPDGKSGTEAWSKMGANVCLTTKAASDPRKVDAFLAMLDAYYADIDYAVLANYGIEGKHYEMTEDGPIRIMEGTELRNEGVLQVSFGTTPDLATKVQKGKQEFGRKVTGNGYWRVTLPPVQEWQDINVAQATLIQTTYTDMITGVKPVDYFDTFVEEWKKMGADKAEKAVQDAYVARTQGAAK